jgi:hypothetical protein
MKTFKTHLLTKEDLPSLRGAAYAISGIIKGLGVRVIEEDELLKNINEVCFHKKNSKPHNKIAGLYLYETLSITLGKSFEIFLEKVIDNILSQFADSKEEVRIASKQAMKAVMKNLSGYAVKKLLPVFIEGIQRDNWRSKMASSEALGNIAYCAPR